MLGKESRVVLTDGSAFFWFRTGGVGGYPEASGKEAGVAGWVNGLFW